MTLPGSEERTDVNMHWHECYAREGCVVKCRDSGPFVGAKP